MIHRYFHSEWRITPSSPIRLTSSEPSYGSFGPTMILYVPGARPPYALPNGKDISENGRIRIPDWFYIGGIILVLVAGAIALWDQTKTLIRKIRHRGDAP